MGNSRWRLETALNFLAKNVHKLRKQGEVEVIVADWGSDTPLSHELNLTPEASQIVSFIKIPKEKAVELQRDSPFAEVFALNIAARRARGEFIGRIDQDTLVGQPFFEAFDRVAKDPALNHLPMFANLKMIPYRLAVKCPPLAVLEKFIHRFGKSLTLENAYSNQHFYIAGVGIWLAHRDLWHECGGYDERMIYMNAMETNMILRLQKKYSQVVDIGKLSDYPFYHLEHYHPWKVRKTSTHRKVNPHLPFSEPEEMNPNGPDWGLNNTKFEVTSGKTSKEPPPSNTSFVATMLLVAPRMSLDSIGLFLRDAPARLWHRISVARETIAGKPVYSWPRLLKERWGR